MAWRNKFRLKSGIAERNDATETTRSNGIAIQNLKDCPAPHLSLRRGLPRIFVVDDDAALRQRYYDVLIQSGYRVDAVADTDSGWEMFYAARHGSDNYQLLITNNLMPGLSGFDLFKTLPMTRKTLLIFPASGKASANAERLRLHAILPNPVASSDLVQRVQLALRVEDNKSPFQIGSGATTRAIHAG